MTVAAARAGRRSLGPAGSGRRRTFDSVRVRGASVRPHASRLTGLLAAQPSRIGSAHGARLVRGAVGIPAAGGGMGCGICLGFGPTRARACAGHAPLTDNFYMSPRHCAAAWRGPSNSGSQALIGASASARRSHRVIGSASASAPRRSLTSGRPGAIVEPLPHAVFDVFPLRHEDHFTRLEEDRVAQISHIGTDQRFGRCKFLGAHMRPA